MHSPLQPSLVQEIIVWFVRVPERATSSAAAAAAAGTPSCRTTTGSSRRTSSSCSLLCNYCSTFDSSRSGVFRRFPWGCRLLAIGMEMGHSVSHNHEKNVIDDDDGSIRNHMRTHIAAAATTPAELSRLHQGLQQRDSAQDDYGVIADTCGEKIRHVCQRDLGWGLKKR